MVVAEIVHLGGSALSGDDSIHKATKALKEVQTPKHFVIGTHVQDTSAVQILLEWDGAQVQDYANSKDTPESRAFIDSVGSVFGKPRDIWHVDFNRSAFSNDGPAMANVVEYAQTWFPASQVTAEFQTKIESDFHRFDEAFIKGAEGTNSWAKGWLLEEQEHEDIKGEKAKCFLVIRGWESMGHFERTVQSEAFKGALPILFGWGAPYKMWHVERRIRDGSEVVE